MEGVREAGGFPIEFNTIAVSDAISMGHEGMRASLVSREIIADSVEAVMHAERLDAFVSFAGCDKSLPGMLMAGGAPEPAERFRVRRLHPAGAPPRPGHRHRQRLRGRGRARGGRHRRRRTGRHRAQRLPQRGQLRRHVHRQHDGLGRRGTRHVAAGQRLAVGPRQPPRRHRPCQRRRRHRPAARRHPAPRHHVQGRLRERHRPGHGPRRLHQRGAASCWPSPTRRASNSNSTTSTRWRRGCRTSPTPSRTAATTWPTSTGSAACPW